MLSTRVPVTLILVESDRELSLSIDPSRMTRQRLLEMVGLSETHEGLLDARRAEPIPTDLALRAYLRRRREPRLFVLPRIPRSRPLLRGLRLAQNRLLRSELSLLRRTTSATRNLRRLRTRLSDLYDDSSFPLE